MRSDTWKFTTVPLSKAVSTACIINLWKLLLPGVVRATGLDQRFSSGGPQVGHNSAVAILF